MFGLERMKVRVTVGEVLQHAAAKSKDEKMSAAW
jgi:hypothetical protein